MREFEYGYPWDTFSMGGTGWSSVNLETGENGEKLLFDTIFHRSCFVGQNLVIAEDWSKLREPLRLGFRRVRGEFLGKRRNRSVRAMLSCSWFALLFQFQEAALAASAVTVVKRVSFSFVVGRSDH